MSNSSINSIVICHTNKDPGALRIESEAQNFKIKTHRYNYEQLSTFDANQLYSLPITSNTLLICRSPLNPYRAEFNYSSIVNILLESYKPAYLLDQKLISQYSYHQYGDKRFQSYLFDKFKLPHANLISFNSQEPLKLPYPLIGKKRISARGIGHVIIKSTEEYLQFIKTHTSEEFIIEKFHHLTADYRVLMIQDEIITTVERSVNIKSDNTIKVQVKNEVTLPFDIQKQCLQLQKNLQYDFCGVDIGLTQEDKYIFIEYNISPQFTGSERETKNNIAQTLLSTFIK